MKPRILLADDDFDIRSIIRDCLEMEGYQVFLATNGREALEIIAREKPDLVLLDLSMPEIDGWEVARRVRQSPTISRTPLIAFTAHAMNGDERRAREAGCDDYITKPFNPAEVLEKIQFFLNKSPGVANTPQKAS